MDEQYIDRFNRATCNLSLNGICSAVDLFQYRVTEDMRTVAIDIVANDLISRSAAAIAFYLLPAKLERWTDRTG